jgi:hypothetical protein
MNLMVRRSCPQTGNAAVAPNSDRCRVHPYGGTLPLSSPSASSNSEHPPCFAPPTCSTLQQYNGPLGSDDPTRAGRPPCQEFSSLHRCPHRATRRGTPFIRTRRHRSWRATSTWKDSRQKAAVSSQRSAISPEGTTLTPHTWPGPSLRRAHP